MGKNPVGFLIDENGHPQLNLFDRETKAGVTLNILSHGNPNLRLFDLNGIIRTEVSINQANKPSIELFDEKSKHRAALESIGVKNERTCVMEIRPLSSLLLYDENGEFIFSAPRK